MTSQAPTVSIQLNVSNPVFDLDSHSPWSISVSIVLHHNQPITILGLEERFINNRSRTSALTFTDTSTGQDLPTASVCTLSVIDGSPQRGPRPGNLDLFTTLYPGQTHVIYTDFTPRYIVPFFPQANYWTSPEDPKVDAERSREWYAKRQRGEVAKEWRWAWTGGLKDGREYRVGLPGETLGRAWQEGTREDIMAKQTGWISWLRGNREGRDWYASCEEEPIRTSVYESVLFRVKRADENERMSGL